MKLISIEGKIWELTILQSDTYADHAEVSLEDKNFQAIMNLGWMRGIVRTLANHGVKSKAFAVIEIVVNGLPHQMRYDIYHDRKGFFCRVQGAKVYLETLIEKNNKQEKES